MDKILIFQNNNISKIRKSYSKSHRNKNFSKNKINKCLNNSSKPSEKFTPSLKKILKINPQKKSFKQVLKIAKEKIMKTEEKMNLVNKNRRIIKIIRSKKEKNKRVNRNENKQNNLYIMQSFGDNPIKINKPKESYNYYFKNFEEKKEEIKINRSVYCSNNLNIFNNINENHKENEIKNKITKCNMSEYCYPKISKFKSDNIKLLKDKNQKEYFFENNKANVNKEEEISLYNNELNNLFNNVKNNLDINLSSDEKFSKYKISFYFNHFINQTF